MTQPLAIPTAEQITDFMRRPDSPEAVEIMEQGKQWLERVRFNVVVTDMNEGEDQ